jgi:hypothetical protein
MNIFRMKGQVIDQKTGRGIAGIRVEAWDEDTVFHHALGIQHTDAQGRFTITYDERYNGPVLPELFFKVFHGEELLASTEKTLRWKVDAGDSSALISVEAPVDAPLALPESTEVGLSELGESLALAARGMQQELVRYPETLGAFVLDDLELNIPVRMRVNELGQVMATVMQVEQPGAVLGHVRMRLRPAPGATSPLSAPACDLPLERLGSLEPEVLQKLRAQRVFSVGEFMRVAQSPGGRAALEKLGLGHSLRTALSQAALLSLPAVPAGVGEKLLELGVRSPGDFADMEPARVARQLSASLRQPITSKMVKSWQSTARTGPLPPGPPSPSEAS